MVFSEVLRFRAEPGLPTALAHAARRARVKPAEYLRQAVREAIERDGIALPEPDEALPRPRAPERRVGA